MRKVELRPLESNQPGFGQLIIIGWQGTSEGLSVDIQRNQDEYFLQKDGQWSSNTFKFHLPALQHTADGNLAAMVDRQVVDPLLENPHATNMVRFYESDGTQVGQARLRLGQGLMPSVASGNSPEANASTTLDTPQPPPASSQPKAAPEPAISEPAPVPPAPQQEPEPAAASAQPEPMPAPASKGKGKRWLWALLAIVLLAAVLGAAAWFGLAMRDQEEPPAAEEPVVEENLEAQEATLPEASLSEASTGNVLEASEPDEPAQTDDTAAAGPCSLQRMGEAGELEFIQACTNAGSEAGNMMEVINEALANDHCGIARRLYAYQALNGDAAAALAYAREFDPAHYAPNACFSEANAETAIFWYETALNVDPANAEAKQRLEELQ